MNDLDYIIMDWCQYSLNDFVANEKVLSNNYKFIKNGDYIASVVWPPTFA